MFSFSVMFCTPVEFFHCMLQFCCRGLLVIYCFVISHITLFLQIIQKDKLKQRNCHLASQLPFSFFSCLTSLEVCLILVLKTTAVREVSRGGEEGEEKRIKSKGWRGMEGKREVRGGEEEEEDSFES